MSVTGRCLLVLTAVALVTTAASAQPLTRLEFSFSNPGARSLGLGGAFVALADDATAAFANPGGLVQLIRPEISLEGRLWSYETPFLESGRITGPPTGIGIDTVAGLVYETSSDDRSGVSFLSGVIPAKRWSIAFYRHQLANFGSTSATRGIFLETDEGVVRNRDFRVRTEFDIASYGVSAAFGITTSFSLGVGFAFHEGEIGFLAETFIAPGPFEPASFDPADLFVEQRVATDDTDWTFLAGFLWRASPRWRVGGIYRQGPGFTVSARATAGPRFPTIVEPGTVIDTGSAPLDLPDVYGLGVAHRAIEEKLTVSFEWSRVEYSTLISSLNGGNLEITGVALDDADELHLGLEYVFPRSRPIVGLRFGAWLDPDHRIRDATGLPLESALAPAGDDEMHYAGGVGLVFSHFQVDLAVDVSELVETAALSFIYKF